MIADAALVCRCLKGDPVACRELVERFQADVFAVCHRLLAHAHDAEDVTQEVFLRIFRSLARWDSSRPLRPWILGIAVNRCRTVATKRARYPESADYLHEAPDTRSGDDSRELRHEIRIAVDSLRQEFREVFVLFHEAGQSYEEIAVAIDRPVGTIKTWLHRARGELLEHLTARGFIPRQPVAVKPGTETAEEGTPGEGTPQESPLSARTSRNSLS